jgi:hypothetical protein
MTKGKKKDNEVILSDNEVKETRLDNSRKTAPNEKLLRNFGVSYSEPISLDSP